MAITEQNSSPTGWRQGDRLEVDVFDLGDDGTAVARSSGRVIFVPDGVPGDRLRVRLTEVKPRFARAVIEAVLEPSEDRVRPACIVADKCGGCQWQQVSYELQLESKTAQVREAMRRIGGFEAPPLQPILAADSSLGYRNKATYPLGLSAEGTVQAGYFRRGSHKLVNLNRCPVQDERLDPLLAEVKQDIEAWGWSIYDEATHRGQLRHLALRVGRHTGERLLTLVSTDAKLEGLAEQALVWMNRYPGLMGVCLNINTDKGNRIFGDRTRCIVGRDWIEERFCGLSFRISPQTFFQVNTEQAERIIPLIADFLEPTPEDCLVDAYCGIGTLALPLAGQVGRMIGLESFAGSVEQARANAAANGITNAEFRCGPAELLLPSLSEQPRLAIIDPPRKGCDRRVIEAINESSIKRLVYVSCRPATQARDLAILCGEGGFRLISLTPVDFFPQTAHVECLAMLER